MPLDGALGCKCGPFIGDTRTADMADQIDPGIRQVHTRLRPAINRDGADRPVVPERSPIPSSPRITEVVRSKPGGGCTIGGQRPPSARRD